MNIVVLGGTGIKNKALKWKIKNFKKILIKEKIDGYLIPKNDEFFGEYTPDHNDRLKFIKASQAHMVFH